jgi:hypothetical protein
MTDYKLLSQKRNRQQKSGAVIIQKGEISGRNLFHKSVTNLTHTGAQLIRDGLFSTG